MRKARVSSSLEEPNINITPLIDVVFVVLIMFILIAPLVDKEAVDLAKGGEGDDRELKAASPIAMVVKKNSELYLNRMPVDLDELKERLLEVKAQFPQAIPQLFHDKMAPFWHLPRSEVGDGSSRIPRNGACCRASNALT